jgi:hypothetical protein
MNILQRIQKFFTPPSIPADPSYWVQVRCRRCGETIRARVDLRNDLSQVEGEGDLTFYCRKVLVGEQRCFNRIEVELVFDAQRKLVNWEVTGGELVRES